METESLGLIETLGLVGAIEAADAGTKAANVTFRGYERGRAGLITVVFTGDVAAVRTAVAAGTAAAKRVGQVVCVHVIARPHNQLHVDRGDAERLDQSLPAPQRTVATSKQLLAESNTEAPGVPAEFPAVAASTYQTDAEQVAAFEHSAVAVAEAERVERAAEGPAEGWAKAAAAAGEGDSRGSTTAPEAVPERASAQKKVRKAKLRKRD